MKRLAITLTFLYAALITPAYLEQNNYEPVIVSWVIFGLVTFACRKKGD